MDDVETIKLFVLYNTSIDVPDIILIVLPFDLESG